MVGAQTVVSLLQTTRMILDVCFITDHVPYASSDKNQNRLNRDGTLLSFLSLSFFIYIFFYPGWMRLMFTCVLGR